MTIMGLYADGGVIEKNPSSLGGTWAFVQVDETGMEVRFKTGVITPAEARMETVTNNLTEILALIYGLEDLPADFAGTVYTDSQVSLGRISQGWKWSNIPLWVHQRYQAARKRLVNYERLHFVLLAGHPTKAQLASGLGKRGHPVSIHNVSCDKLCGESAEKFLRNALRPA